MSMIWKPQINYLFYGHLLVMAALDMSDPYWPLIMHHTHNLTATEIQYWSAAIYIAPLLTTIISTPFFGYLGTRVGQKKMVLRAGFALAGTQLCIAFMSNPLHLVILRLVQGLFAGFTAASQAWAIAITPREAHSYVMGRLQAATAIGTIAGPMIGGVVATIGNYAAIFLLSALICMGSTIALAKLLQEVPKISTNRIKSRQANFLGLTGFVIYILLLICFIQAARWMIAPFFALYVHQRLGGNQLAVGTLYSITALTVFLSSPLWGKLIDKRVFNNRGVLDILIGNLLSAAVIHFLLAFATNYYLALALRLILGLNLSAITIIPFALLVRQAQVHHQGSAVGFGNSALKLGNLIGIAAGALIQAQFNFTVSLVLIGLVYGLLAGFLYFKPLRS